MTAVIIFWLIAIAASAVFNLWADYMFESTISELRHLLYKWWRSFLNMTDDYE